MRTQQRCGGLIAGAALALAVVNLMRPQDASHGAICARQLPPWYHPITSWPSPEPVRVHWRYPTPSSRDVTQLFETYPLRPEMLRHARVSDPQWGRAPFWRLLGRLEAGQRVRVAVLGGSEAAGTGCDDGSTRLAGCSWSARFVRWLDRAYPLATIEYENHGAGGTTTAGILPSLRPILEGHGRPPLDLVLIDFLANDAFEAQDWLATKGGAYANTEPEQSSHSRLAIVEAATSILLSRLRERHPETALLLFEPLCTVQGAIAKVDTAQCYGTQDAHVASAKAFRVPVVSYRDVVWPLAQRDSAPHARFWCCNQTSHPRWEAHQLMADVLVHAWKGLVDDLCVQRSADDSGSKLVELPPPSLASLVSPDLLQRYDQCREPATVFDAKDLHMSSRHSRSTHPIGNHPDVVSGDWKLYEDRKGKPGWIAEEAGATLRFGLTFGASPRVVFTFLRSYEQLGSVTVGFAAAAGDEAGKQQSRNKVAGAVYEIDGIWPEGTMPPGDGGRVSQVHSLALNVQQAEVQQRHGDAAMVGFGVQPFSHRSLLVRLNQPGKFKILSVVSC